LFSGTGVAWLYNSRQKNIYKSLLQAQEEFRTTLYSIGDAVITTDKRGKIKQLNKVAEQLTGWREAEVKGQSVERVFNIINEETRSKVEGPFRKIMDKGKIVGLANHTILVTKQGNDIPISDSGAPIKNDKNDIIGTVLVFRDQTKERRAQKLISKRLSLLEYSSEHTLEEVLRKTIDDICGLTNSSTGFYHILGPDRKTLHLQVWSSKTTMEHGKEKEPDRPAEFTSEWAECIRQEKPVLTKDYSTLVPGKNIRKKHTGFVNELVIPVSKSGKIVAIAGIRNKSDDYDEHDTEIIAYLAGIAWEIAERKKAKESLEEERRLLNSLISAIPDHIYFKDKDCRFIRINNAMSDRLELNDPDEAIGKTDANFFGKEHATQTHKDEKTIIKTGKPLVNIEEKEDWEDGTITWASTTKIPLRDKNGKITGIMGISRDITDRKKMEEELISAKNKAEQSDMLKSAFLANMSHEIRTPLNGILGFTDILVKNNDLTQEEKNHYSSIIAKSAEGLLQVIDDILDLSLIEAGDMQIEVSSFNAEKTLNELSTLYSEKIDELNRNIKLELSIEKNVVIQSDENRLRQIFINLLDNAIKFTEKGEIKFGAERIGPDEIIFFVSDTGIGIPEEMHELIFDRFRQIDVSSTRGHSGNGLGLSIVKKLVELMKGKIWVESDGRKGTVFRFSLPYAKQETVPDDDSSKKTQEIIPVELPVVLLVEDDPVSRLFIEEILKRKCRKLVSASNGKEALTKSRSEKFDVILMDIRLPDINGLDLVRKIRNFDQKVYIIAQSAYAMHADAEKAKSAGCNDYISKPIDTDLLLEKLAGIHNN
jgi:PAS domain S-box-containing protein